MIAYVVTNINHFLVMIIEINTVVWLVMTWFMVSIYFVRFGDVLHQIVVIPMGTNYVFSRFVLYCYESHFWLIFKMNTD